MRRSQKGAATAAVMLGIGAVGTWWLWGGEVAPEGARPLAEAAEALLDERLDLAVAIRRQACSNAYKLTSRAGRAPASAKAPFHRRHRIEVQVWAWWVPETKGPSLCPGLI